MTVFEEIMEKFLAGQRLSHNELVTLLEDEKTTVVWANTNGNWTNGKSVFEYKGSTYRVGWKILRKINVEYDAVYQPEKVINVSPPGKKPFYQEVA